MDKKTIVDQCPFEIYNKVVSNIENFIETY